MILDKNGKSLNKYMVHTLSNPLQQLYQSMDVGRKRLQSLPVCPKCERTGFRDAGWATNKIMTCPHCGYHGKATHVLSAYLAEGAYK